MRGTSLQDFVCRAMAYNRISFGDLRRLRGTEGEPGFLMLWGRSAGAVPNQPFPGAFQGRSNYELPLIFTARPSSHASDRLGGRYANRGNVRAAC
jgi:hypothetical protein